MNRGEIRTIARALADEKIATNQVVDADVNTFINNWYQFVVSQINGIEGLHYFGAIDTSINLVNGTDNYALPDLDANSRTRVMDIQRVEIASSANNFVQARPISLLALPDTSEAAITYTSQNPRFYIYGSRIRVLPTPSANITGGIKLWYDQRQTDMSTDASIPNFPDEYHHILKYPVAADIIRIFLDQGYKVNTDDMMQTFYGLLKKMIETIQPRDNSEYPTVLDVAGFGSILQEDYVEPGSLTVLP